MTRCVRLLRPWPHTRNYATGPRFAAAKSLQKLHDPSFDPNEPAVWPYGFTTMPAITKWFTPSTTYAQFSDLNTEYLDQYGDTYVTLELTRPTEPAAFERFEAPLAMLFAYMTMPSPPGFRMYLAQQSLADLPDSLQTDIPTPELISTLGRGDVYASSLWMGCPPTRTPLHRDPNPNLFVQLAGTKTVRLLHPDLGRAVYERARARAGRHGMANMRGEEMMIGAEMEALEDAVWGNTDTDAVAAAEEEGIEAQLGPGDGLYIPLGWWHAVRGTGAGANTSANWWFR